MLRKTSPPTVTFESNTVAGVTVIGELSLLSIKFVKIGSWIDNKIDNDDNKNYVEQFGPEDANMEMLGTREDEIYIPSCDNKGNIIQIYN